MILSTGGGGTCSGGVPGPRGGAWSRRGACSGGCLLWGVPAPGGGCLLPGGRGPGGDSPRDGYCCGRYASYWNGFFFIFLA